MTLAAYHRIYDLAWDGDPQSSRRFRRILRILLGLAAIIGVAMPFLPRSLPTVVPAPIPPQVAQVLLEKPAQPQPLPKPRPRTQPVSRPVMKPQVRPVAVRPDRSRAQRSIDQVRDQLADLRRQLSGTPVQTGNLTGAVAARSHAQRALISAQAGEASAGAGIASAPLSRGFGGGAGSLQGVQAGRISSSILQAGLDARGAPQRAGTNGAGRSEEEIAMVFDRNKGAIYALYERALRSNPRLEGKVVLEFTIAPSGAVVHCRIVSSELADPTLEREIVARVMLFHFQPEKVAPTTATKPIDFFPA